MSSFDEKMAGALNRIKSEPVGFNYQFTPVFFVYLGLTIVVANLVTYLLSFLILRLLLNLYLNFKHYSILWE